MKNNFLSKAYGGVIVARNKLNGLGLPRQWKVMTSTLLLLFTLAIGQMWGTCDPGTIFKFEVKGDLTNGNIAKGNPIDLSSYVTVTAGSVSAYGKNDGSLAIVDTKAISIAKKAEAYFIFTLSEGCSLQEGDIIKYIVYNKNALLQPETTTSDAADKLTLTKTSNVTTYGSVVIPAEHALIGESTFYLFTGDNACKVKSIEICRPATITLDATTNGGSVGTTSLKGVVGDKVGLPHAFKTGKKFKGWYTTADGNVKKDDAYTVAGDITLYAQFEDIPVSGEMFSLTMEDELKPLEQCTIVSAVSKSTHLLSPVELTLYATVSGGSAVLSNSSTSNHAFISNSTASAILNGGNGCLTITLESALQEGDVITTSIASQNISYTVEATRNTTNNFTKGDDKTLEVTSDSPLKGKNVIYLWSGSSAGGALKSMTITRPTPHTLSYAVDPAGKGTVTLGATSLIEGATTTATYSAIDAAYEFDEWQISGTGASIENASANPAVITMGSTDATVTLKLKAAVTKYTITYNPGAYGTGTAIPDGQKDEGVDFTLSDATYSRDGYVQTGWSETDGGDKAYDLGGTYSTDDDEELFPFWTPVYTVTKGAHDHGDFTISPASLVAGGTVTLDPTPADGYMFSAWEVVKTSDASATGITVTNKQFEMPAYGVTINATFVADTRKKVLYLTTTNEANTKANDKLYAALKDDYNVTIAAPGSQTLTDYDLIVLHESIGGSVAGSDGPVKDAATTSVPVLNTKTYFYNSGRWDWGTPNNGQAAQKVATLNSGYCNVADHPIFAGVTIAAGAVTVLTNDATGNTMQPVAPSSGKEGYLLATTPNASSGVGYAIQEIPAGGFRGASSGKYILISVSNAGLNNLTADGQKLFQNAAAYLVGSTTWTPISVPTSPEVTATPSENYTEGNTITLTTSATGTTASTTYTWYKGDDWATASATTPVQAAATVASDGNVFTKTAVLGDAGTYWCNISNGTSCDVQASVTITVASASTPTHAITYDNTKGADMSAYPTEYTEGVGIASFAALADITGWHFVEWSPATIETTATTDQTITAVWAQVFEVTFDLQGHGASIDAQNIVDGGKVTKPNDPVAIGWDFGGWFTDAECTAGNEWDFDNDVVTATTPLYAKWTAFDGCTLLVPATSGDALIVGATVDLQSGSTGATIKVANLNGEKSIDYNAYGLSFGGGGKDSVRVTLNNDLQVGSVITVRLVSNGTTHENGRGLNLFNAAHVKKALLGWQADEEVAKYDELSFSYTVTETDGFAGTNIIGLSRQNSVFLKWLKVTNCGSAVVYHNLTSAIVPDHDPAYATVTLGATSVREGYTTTATYSDIDATYEFDEWQISGTGASIADASANPAVITMGTADAVVTLKLKVKPVYYTVTYYDGASEMGTEQVAENGHPTATGITTKKLGYNFLGWSETDGGAVVELNNISITDAKNLYAKYEAVVCPTSGTIFLLNMNKTVSTAVDVRNGSVDLDEYATISGGSATLANTSNNTRAQVTTTPSIRLSNGGEGYIQVELDCPVLEGDIIRYVNISSGTIGVRAAHGNATNETVLQGNKTEITTVEVNAALDGLHTIYLDRRGNTSDLTYFEIYRRPALTGVSLADLTIRQGQSKTPVMTLEPSADARVTSQVWEIVGTPTNLTGAAIDPATGAITTGTLDDPTSTGSISVKVTLNGSIEATCTATIVGNIDQQNVTKSTVWDWHNTGATANIQLTNDTDPKKNENFVLANVAVNNNDEFESDKLAVEGEHIVRDYNKTNPYFQGQLIQFHTTVAGVVRVKFAHTGNATAEKPARELYINGVATGDTRANATPAWSNYIEVPAGDVSITAHYVNLLPAAAQQYIRVFEIEFYAYDTERADSWIAPGELGTICYPNGHIITGAEVYEMAGVDENNKFVFDQVEKTEPGKPYLFVATSYDPIKLYKTTAAAEVSPIANNGMIGTFVSINLDYTDERAAKWYYFSGKKFYAVSKRANDLNVPANRAYVDLNESHPAGAPKHGVRRITFDVQGANVATGVEDVQGDNVQCTKVLINGQLFILRGEKMYDAMGQLVK